MTIRAPLPLWPPTLWTSTPGTRSANTSVNWRIGAVGTIVSARTVPMVAPCSIRGRGPAVAGTESRLATPPGATDVVCPRAVVTLSPNAANTMATPIGDFDAATGTSLRDSDRPLQPHPAALRGSDGNRCGQTCEDRPDRRIAGDVTWRMAGLHLEPGHYSGIIPIVRSHSSTNRVPVGGPDFRGFSRPEEDDHSDAGSAPRLHPVRVALAERRGDARTRGSAAHAEARYRVRRDRGHSARRIERRRRLVSW